MNKGKIKFEANLIAHATSITSAYVANNKISVEQVPTLIEQIYNALANIESQGTIVEKPVPVVAPEKSVTPDYIICLEDGKELKMLKRHIMSRYNLTAAEYRSRWGLPGDYPMVAPNYAKQRSQLAKKNGLGANTKRKSTV